MNEKLFVLNSQKKNTNHILHLILSLVTGGLWIIVWIIVASSDSNHNKKIDKQINQILQYKAQGFSDGETYRRVDSNEAAQKLRNDQIFILSVIAIGLALFYFLKS
ncbi:hypothetical protein [Pseudomonas sp. KB_12]|uniref:hypothetical protein n=1 Tax=Pseudomonas sp. KB_12 TaxID=3233034 RepID=UPI003F980CA4